MNICKPHFSRRKPAQINAIVALVLWYSINYLTNKFPLWLAFDISVLLL